jgi:hypothetical protein
VEPQLEHQGDHPVRLVVEDTLRRKRLTVFFRILLAIPHFIWSFLWTIAMIVVAVLNWFAALTTGRPASGLHRFTCRYVRYQTHLSSYLTIAANPYPGFVGEEDTYPIEVRLPGPEPQPRLQTFFRIFLAVPALLVAGSLGGLGNARVPSTGRSRAGFSGGIGGLLSVACSILGWFASVFTGRMPKGLRDAAAYSIGYSAQTLSYVLLVTSRYPNSDPTQLLESVERPPVHPVHLVGDADDLRRSRVLVFFRLPLTIPHYVWLLLWSIAVFFVVIVNWFALLFTGRPVGALHRFVARFVHYSVHVYAFLFLAANPFPGFVGEPGTYPLDVELPEPERQDRWVTGFRVILAIPAALINWALLSALFVAAILTWFHALVRGTAPWGLRNLSAYAIRYQAQYNAYALLLTERYPHASPLEGSEPAQQHFELETA